MPPRLLNSFLQVVLSIKGSITEFVLDSRLLGLMLKETRQILRDKHLLFLLIFPPTLQLLLLGAALNPGLHDVCLDIVDHCGSVISRRLTSEITSGAIFHNVRYLTEDKALENDINNGIAKVGIVIPGNFDSNLTKDHVAGIQIVVDGVDAYTSNLISSYLVQIVHQFEVTNERKSLLIEPHLTTLYNPGLISSWYFLPGIMGAMLTLTSTLISSAALLREKELGTLEQLLMTPCAVWEILLAKVGPIFFLLMIDACIMVVLSASIFSLPFRGNPILFLIACALYILIGIGMGMTLATVCKNERQSHLISFFVNVPVMQLSGSVVPYETMPEFLRNLSAFDPLRYFTAIVRALLLKGSGINYLWTDFLMLTAFTLALFAFSIVRFRRQLN